MGISLNQFDQLAGGAYEGYMGQQENRRANRADDREQAGEDRVARDDTYEQTFNAIQANRAQLDDIGGEAIPGGPPQGGAIPTGSSPTVNEGAPAGGAPGAPQQSEFGSRREAYKDWYKRSSAASAMAGGLEGVKAFQDHESALSRKQMMGYGMAGVQAMAAGQAGEAVKQLNTMLEVSPEDPGLKFEAFDGKVHLVGKDGKRSEPYNQEQVMGLIESKLKTPENYLAFQKESREQGVADESVRSAMVDEAATARAQTETERAAISGEAATDRAQTEVERGALVTEEETMLHHVETETTGAQNADSVARQVDILEKKLPAHLAKTGAEIIKLLKDADSNAMRADALAKQGSLGWTDTHKLKIMTDLPTFIQNAKTDPGLSWIAPMIQDPNMGLLLQNGMTKIMLDNPPGSVDFAAAVSIGTLAYSGIAQVTLPEGTKLPPMKKEGGQWYVQYAGQQVAVPDHVAKALQMSKDQASGKLKAE